MSVSTSEARLSVPPEARLTINRCDLPAEALGSLAFQLAPRAIELDGVLPLHGALFALLAEESGPHERARLFQAYMAGHFLLGDAGANGLTDHARHDRSRLDYLRLLRGWLFDAEGREAAVLKAWVESRLGLLTRFHRQPVGGPDTSSREAFEKEMGQALYGTGALESQIDLLYAYCQYELAQRLPGKTHLRLYRGVSGAAALECIATLGDGSPVLLLNNLSSFSASRERADEFGDRVMSCEVPLTKVLAFSRLLPGRLQGEEEYLVIGGVARVRWEN